VPERPLVVVLGWHGSTERQLRVIARWYEARGHAVRVVITPTFRTMGRRGAWPAFGRRLARELGETKVILHAFSNAGFWTMSALLDAMKTKPLCVVIDSAPGFPETIPMWFTAKFATAAMMPSLLARAGRTPRTYHRWLSPPLAVFFGAWHLVAREQVRFMETGQARVIERIRGVPLLAIWSDADTLVPAEHVASFLDRAEHAAIPVTRLHLPDSAHVRHFVQHRHAYFAALAAFLDAA
jgi:fermentation-respiration switch protein FrsA (DUF1100 family)